MHSLHTKSSIIFQSLHSLWKNPGNCSLYENKLQRSGKKQDNKTPLDETQQLQNEDHGQDWTGCPSLSIVASLHGFYLVEIATFFNMIINLTHLSRDK